MKTILVTGALGSIGSYLMLHLTEYLRKRYKIIFTDLYKPQKKSLDENFIVSDLSSVSQVRKIFNENDIDVVIHLAAQSSKMTHWKDLLPSNIIMPYNIFQVAAENQCS